MENKKWKYKENINLNDITINDICKAETRYLKSLMEFIKVELKNRGETKGLMQTIMGKGR